MGWLSEEEADFNTSSLERNAKPRVRRNISEYENDPASFEQLRRAFEGMMAKDPTDPSGYFMLAGIHWLPAPAMYCRHHEYAYIPWH